MNIDECKPGVRVVYYPSGKASRGYVGVVREDPWQLGNGSWVTHLHGMESAYRDGARSTVYAAWVDALDVVRETAIKERGTCVVCGRPPNSTDCQRLHP